MSLWKKAAANLLKTRLFSSYYHKGLSRKWTSASVFWSSFKSRGNPGDIWRNTLFPSHETQWAHTWQLHEKSTIVLSAPVPAFPWPLCFSFRVLTDLKLSSWVLMLCNFICTKRQVYLPTNFFYLNEWNLTPVRPIGHRNSKKNLSLPPTLEAAAHFHHTSLSETP